MTTVNLKFLEARKIAREHGLTLREIKRMGGEILLWTGAKLTCRRSGRFTHKWYLKGYHPTGADVSKLFKFDAATPIFTVN